MAWLCRSQKKKKFGKPPTFFFLLRNIKSVSNDGWLIFTRTAIVICFSRTIIQNIAFFKMKQK